MEKLVLGPGVDPATDLGPLVNAPAREKVEELVGGALDEGSTVLTGASRPDRRGWFYAATVLGDVPPDAAILREEVFGPVAPIVAFEDEDEAVRLANDTEFGLVSYVYTGDLARGLRVCEALEAGMVGLNRGLVSDPAAPFGGVKQSGLGRELGPAAVAAFTEVKNVFFSSEE
jgi:succinate-semialdehyde dehydrogenase/glutarate-semialdehyde dehydrogenase